MSFSPEELESLRQEGPDPTDYREDSGKIDWTSYEKDYDSWADKTGFPN